MGKFAPMEVVFDTGSDWLVIESSECSNCAGDTYDLSSSVLVGNEISERQYGSAIFKGKEYQDTVCILLSACVFDFEYFAVYEQAGLSEPIDGILGLARPNKHYMEGPIAKAETGPLLLDELVKQGVIDEKTFSFYFTGQLGGASIDFGAPQASAMRRQSELVYIGMLDDFFWSASLAEVQWRQQCGQQNSIRSQSLAW